MCRLLYYCGKKVRLKSILMDKENSLWNQSVNCKRAKWFNMMKRDHLVNVDGFGVGWFDEDDDEFCIYKTTRIPLHDQNFLNLSKHVRSGIVCGHLRAVKSHKNCKIIRDNCHPFGYDKIMFMHNGLITNFRKNYLKLLGMIGENYREKIEGTTDSENIFYYYLTLLGDKLYGYEMDHYLRKFLMMIGSLRRIFEDGIISANIVIITPQFTIASRFINNDEEPPSLYIKSGEDVILSSEPLEKEGYKLVEKNSCILVKHSNKVVANVRIDT